MKELIVISGKGGTGKTSIVGAIAALARNAVLADCDVDAADLHLILKPQIKQTADFVGGKRAEITGEMCNQCGKCLEICRFDAVERVMDIDEIVSCSYRINAVSCEGCGVCAKFCPVNAIKFEDCVNGQWFISKTRFGPMVHAKLGIAEENSGKLVTLIRRQARQIAESQNRDLLIVDGSPGIGCPVIASITGADLVLIVTEPTLSGKHDLQRVAKLAENFRIPALICINKADINTEITRQIENDAKEQALGIAGKISYDDNFTKAQIAQTTVIEYTNGKISKEINSLWQKVAGSLK